MSRLQLLVPLILWALWLSARAEPVCDPFIGTSIYLMSMGMIVVLMRRFARRAMMRSTVSSVRAAGRFHQIMFAVRWLIMAVHLVGLMYLGWGEVIAKTPLWNHPRLETVAALLSAIPVILVWVGLMWAQYPLDRAVREQNMLMALNSGEMIFEPPTMRQYISTGVRVQILSLLAPIAVALLLRDGLLFIADRYVTGPADWVEGLATLLAAGTVFLIGPEILTRVLPVVRLPESLLRDRLEAMCERLGLRYRDILLWRTHYGIGNAAVMGLVPRFRYILLSDLLIETMSPQQIEAVFAHEAGHVVHRHMTWYVVFAAVFVLWLGGAQTLLATVLPVTFPLDGTMAGIGVIGFFIVFGLLSRSFERQADLFAARNLYNVERDDRVDPIGVAAFTSALEHVARINNMPLDARQLAPGGGKFARVYASIVHHAATWLHGSIRSRMEYLQSLPHNPDRTARFDRRMSVIRIALLVALVSTTAWVITSMAR